MKRATYDQLAARERQATEDAGMLHCVLNDVLNNEVQWFRKGNVRLGITRPAGPAGGYVIEASCGYASVYLWDTWWPGVRDHIPNHTDAEGIKRRELAHKAHDYIIQKQTNP